MMTSIEKLTSKGFLNYAIRHYTNRLCSSQKEFQSDLSKIHYVKRLINTYLKNGELREALIINHLVVFYNVFDVTAATRMIYFKMDEKHYPVITPFLQYLSYLPSCIPEVNLNRIKNDEYVENRIREFDRQQS